MKFREWYDGFSSRFQLGVELRLLEAQAELEEGELERLNEVRNELGANVHEVEEYQEYATALGPILVRFEVGGNEVSWPSTTTEQVRFLKSMPPTAVGQIVSAVATGAYDADLIPKS